MSRACPHCRHFSQVEQDTRREHAKDLVMDAWKAGAYADRIGPILGAFDALVMADDAITAVWLVDEPEMLVMGGVDSHVRTRSSAPS